MKKIVALVAAVALAAPLAACGHRDRNISGSPSQQQVSSPAPTPAASADPAAARADITSLDALLASVDSALADADASPADAD